ncbi:hypothetical protein ES675_12225 [Bizionia algoritergicola]|uniref:Uncharacterized protein n=1 Tax=Bizionia algoritergicola TaxID=291187 RepID=A0A5D0QU18_9FLAO|nr:hypothetical protein ES675_12225 [Bizionia algoritergicola]
MIKFFRRIRQGLLNEGLPAGQAGKTSRYFKYTIGEIQFSPIRDYIWVEKNRKVIQRAVRYAM